MVCQLLALLNIKKVLLLYLQYLAIYPEKTTAGEIAVRDTALHN